MIPRLACLIRGMTQSSAPRTTAAEVHPGTTAEVVREVATGAVATRVAIGAVAAATGAVAAATGVAATEGIGDRRLDAIHLTQDFINWWVTSTLPSTDRLFRDDGSWM